MPRRQTPVYGPHLPERLDLAACTAALAIGLATGVVVALYRLALTAAIRLHGLAWTELPALGAAGWALLVAATAATGAVARLVVIRLSPESAGSGIPDVEARLQGDRPLGWRRLLPAKFAGGLLAIGTGMSLGREGPSVQIGAALGEAVADRAASDERTRRALVAAGAGAGLTGAFDAPIAGVLFVLEELRCELVPLTYVTALVASLACQLVVGRTFGEGPLLGLADLPMPGTTGIGLAAACGVACGAAGVLYNAVILALLDLHDRFRSVPDGVKAALAAACAIPVGLFVPAALFGDEGVVMSLVHQGTAPGSPVLAALSGTVASLALLAAVKLVFTATSYASGVVGGLFAPQLVIGAALGTLIGRLAEPIAPGVHLAQVLAIAGAAAVFTASVRVPLTGIVLLLEMTGDVRNGFTIATAAGVAYLVATALRARPLYDALGSRRPPATTAVGSATADQSA